MDWNVVHACIDGQSEKKRLIITQKYMCPPFYPCSVSKQKSRDSHTGYLTGANYKLKHNGAFYNEIFVREMPI